MKVTILGSGTSIGVPMPTCQCEVCQSKDPKDNRLRCSALVETDDQKRILVDCGPDFRMQAIRAGIKELDALLLTHNHFDHCYGLDDLRPFAYFKPLATYADQIMSEALMSRWDYIFVHKYPGVPKLELTTLHPSKVDSFKVGETLVTPIRCYHGKLPMLGYRIGPLAYITDCTRIEPRDIEKLYGVSHLIIDALRWHEHPTHYSVQQAMEIVDILQPKRTVFTHMSHEMGLHSLFKERLMAELGETYPKALLDTIELAYDGMEIEITPNSSLLTPH